MRLAHLLVLMVMCGSMHAQFIAPYNPDSNADSAIGAADMLDFLPLYGTNFIPESITLDSLPQTEWLMELESAVQALQTSVAQLQAERMTLDSVLRLTWKRQLNDLEISAFDFGSQNLFRVNFSGSVLTGSSFSDVYCFMCDFHDADLAFADFTNADLDLSNLQGANLTNASFSFAFLGNCDLDETDLSGVNLSNTYISGASLKCLEACPSSLPSGFVCQSDPDCAESDRFRIVEMD